MTRPLAAVVISPATGLRKLARPAGAPRSAAEYVDAQA